VKKITLSVDDKVRAAARRARARLLQLSNQSQGRLGEKTWTRDDLHAR
jgi:hypothetical protein